MDHWTIGPRWSLEDQPRLLGMMSVWECRLSLHLPLREHVPNIAPAKEAVDHVTVTLLVANDCPKCGQLFIGSPLTSQRPLHDMCGLV